MRYTSKLRLLILLIAILPPLIIVTVLKFSTEQKIESKQKQNIQKLTEKARNFILSEQGRLKYNVQQLTKNQLLLEHLSSKKISKKIPDILIQQYNFDYLAIVNKSGKVVSSIHFQRDSVRDIHSILNQHLFRKEKDQQGEHATLAYMSAIDSTYYIYAGKYINHSMKYLISSIAQAKMTIEFVKKPDAQDKIILMNSPKEKMSILLDFNETHNRQLYEEVLLIISIVTITMMLLAIVVGMYLTSRTKKEVDNLRLAFSEVADGNFDTTVMAYEQSEFSELADSFSKMVAHLKTTQSKLSTVEKIAAWETVGQKLAHEIKNPLTPISIAADDLRSSYYEKLPKFDKTLDETTSTIKKEVKRMTLLLDEFVSFARMKHSVLQLIDFQLFLDDLQTIYAKEISSQKLIIKNNISHTNLHLDRDTFLQLCINLIKNGFETTDDALVKITIDKNNNGLQISISDNGNGFSEAKLHDSFKPFDTTKEKGSGLGLVICHRIILDHDGTMILQNNKNGGGEVVITLPIA